MIPCQTFYQCSDHFYNKPVFPADPRFQEPVLAIDLLRGPQHGIRDPEEDSDPVGPVQEVPGGPHDDPRAVQPVLHQMHQAKRVQEADGESRTRWT